MTSPRTTRPGALRRRVVLRVGGLLLPLLAAGCGSGGEAAPSDTPTSSAAEERRAARAPMGPALRSLDVHLDDTAFTATLGLEDLDPRRSKAVVLYEWEARDVDVVLTVERGRGGAPVVRGSWTDHDLEDAGGIAPRDLDATWDQEGRTVTVVLRDRLGGPRARVTAGAGVRGRGYGPETIQYNPRLVGLRTTTRSVRRI